MAVSIPVYVFRLIMAFTSSDLGALFTSIFLLGTVFALFNFLRSAVRGGRL